MDGADLLAIALSLSGQAIQGMLLGTGQEEGLEPLPPKPRHRSQHMSIQVISLGVLAQVAPKRFHPLPLDSDHGAPDSSQPLGHREPSHPRGFQDDQDLIAGLNPFSNSLDQGFEINGGDLETDRGPKSPPLLVQDACDNESPGWPDRSLQFVLP